MPNAQVWLENQEEYNTKQKREQITELKIGRNFIGKELQGKLNLNDFTNLKKLKCYNNQLTSLDLTNCSQLEELYCYHNQLTNLSLPNYLPNLTKLYCSNNQLTNLNFAVLNPEKLQYLSIGNNNFPPLDLSIFSPFTNLEILKIGNDNEKKIKQNIYNRFSGSLESLKNLTKLGELHIANTDINEINVEQLPRSLEKIEYSADKRSDCKLTQIVPLLDKHRELLIPHLTAKQNQEKITSSPQKKKEYNHWFRNTPYQIHSNDVPTSKIIDTKEISWQLQNAGGDWEFSLNRSGLTELNNQDEQEQKNKQRLQFASSNNLELALDITPKPKKTKSSLPIEKNNEELLAEILTTNDSVKETFWKAKEAFWKQTVSSLEKQINLFAQEEYIDSLMINRVQQWIAKAKKKSVREMNNQEYCEEIGWLQKIFDKLQTNLTIRWGIFNQKLNLSFYWFNCLRK